INLNDNFNTRLLIQKAFYFLTKLGFPFRIKFNFYKYGPYSPELAELYYRSTELAKNSVDNYFKIEFTKEEMQKLKGCKEIINQWGNNPEKLEYYASVLFVYDDMYFSNWNENLVKEKIAALKPELFKKFEFKEVLRELKQFNLINNHN
ncbi:MAG: hypothetical protein ACTSRP_24650, partial [Candidatus Helarchaeota archaeon]